MANGREFKVRDKETGEIFTIREKSRDQLTLKETGQIFKDNFLEAIGKTGKEAAGSANIASFGILKPLAKKVGVDIPERPESVGLNIAATTVGGPGVVARKVGQTLKGSGFFKGIARGSVEGATTGALSPGDLAERGVMAGVGAVSGAAILPALRTLSAFSKISNKQFRREIVNRLITSVKDFNIKLGNTFGKQLDDLSTQNPNRMVNVFDSLENLVDSAKDNPQIGKLLKHPRIARFFDKDGGIVKEFTNISAKEAQEISNLINVPQRAFKVGGARPQDIPLMRAKSAFKADLAEAFPEEIPEIRSKFSQGKTAVKALKKFDREGGVEPAIRRGFDEDIQVQDALETVLKDDPGFIDELIDFASTSQFQKTLKGAATQSAIGVGVAGLLGGLLLTKALRALNK